MAFISIGIPRGALKERTVPRETGGGGGGGVCARPSARQHLGPDLLTVCPRRRHLSTRRLLVPLVIGCYWQMGVRWLAGGGWGCGGGVVWARVQLYFLFVLP